MTRLLIVEDNEMNRSMLARRLTRRGFEVTLAGDGEAAIQMTQRLRPDLVLMDMSLPVLDGWRATQALKGDAATRDIPVIALTAHAMSEDRQRALDAGCDEYETKPIDLPSLLQKIEALTAHRPAAAIRPAEAVPLVVAPAPVARPDTGAHRGGPEALHATLLLVDDDPMNLDLLSRRLTLKGYAVLTATSGLDALALVERHRLDAVLLDVRMPGMSGLETLRRIRLSRPVSELPVIMVTGNDRSEDVVEALELGANDYVTKPIDFPVVLARIRTQVTTRRADPLTGLCNRVLFMDRLDRLLVRGGGESFAVLFLDVDRFKLVNDSLGHVAGDELLVAIAARLTEALKPGDATSRGGASGAPTLARFGGDEFTMLLPGLTDARQARAEAERLLAIMAHPFTLDGREVFVSASIGLVMSAARYTQAEDMVRDADTAMYRAKALGKARTEVFDTSMLLAAEQRLQLETELRRAIERRELEVHYQPIVSLAEEQLCGFEALLRWRHPTRGLIGPSDFIPLAEETGLIVPIGRWVLHEACRQMRGWDREFAGPVPLVINVNLSARQCMHPDLLHDVQQALTESGLRPERLKLEITENIVLENSDEVVDILTRVRRLGVQLGLDDFGMGYSALSYLQRFPFQTLKIDRSFVSGMEDSSNAEIIRAIISLAAGLAMDVTAEGVETASQLEGLKDLACEFGQGFYFCKPLPAPEVGALLRSRGTVAARRGFV